MKSPHRFEACISQREAVILIGLCKPTATGSLKAQALVDQAASAPQEISMKSPISRDGPSASELIDKKIAELKDWRGTTLSQLRELIKETAPDVIEELKWMGTPVWSSGGIICTGETYKSKVKLTFMKGASLSDPSKLFNSSLDGKVRRAIDIMEGDAIDAAAFKALIQAAVTLNTATVKATPRRP